MSDCTLPATKTTLIETKKCRQEASQTLFTALLGPQGASQTLFTALLAQTQEPGTPGTLFSKKKKSVPGYFPCK